MAARSDLQRIDAELAARVARMSPGSQRWLKTTLLTITSTEADEETGVQVAEPDRRPPKRTKEEPKAKPASLEDVVTGKADLRDHLDAYPELAEELDGMADVIDLLREAGARRRSMGERILREEILGETPEEQEEEEDGREG